MSRARRSPQRELEGMRAAAAIAVAESRDGPKDGLAWGLELHRHLEPRDWPAALEQRVPAEYRVAAEGYLRGIAARMRNLRAMAAADGFHVAPGADGGLVLEQWRAYRKNGRRARGEA